MIPTLAFTVWFGRVKGLAERILLYNLSLILALLVLVAIFGSTGPGVFFSSRIFLRIGMSVAILGGLAFAQTTVIVSGGLVIAVGSIVGLTTVAAAIAIQVTGKAVIGLAAGL